MAEKVRASAQDIRQGQDIMMETPSGRFAQTVTDIGLVRVISASDELFNHFDGDLPMWAETGDRSLTVKFEFSAPYHEPPSLTLGVVGIDCDHARNLRYNITAGAISRTGFEVTMVTWDDTRIARASISWQAIGKLPVRVRPARPVRAEPAE